MLRLPLLVCLSLLIHGIFFALFPRYQPQELDVPQLVAVEFERRMRQPVAPVPVARELPRRLELAGENIDQISGRTVALPRTEQPDGQVREFSIPLASGVFGQREMRDSSLERNRRMSRPTPPAELGYVDEHIQELFAQRREAQVQRVVPEVSGEQLDERVQITGDLSQRKITFMPAFPRISVAYAVTMEMMLFVEPSGTVSQVNVLRRTGNEELDRQGMGYAQRIRFEWLPVSHVQRGTLMIEFSSQSP
ncbi:TonB family protein [Desulfurispirillum indicum S5]|uniref:TonB family protein n=1 Tax=Desulfurispirillum indicum (strain ATCC BAA-1389 / DSM 22839 / S5) TaxID=653733 RepID=E6W798_DESIS|nr:TonB family protein [Desulfurispirillum indicum]ADU66265.1 TonB family protein [Desulfurispirillum indicum S5]